MGGDSFGANGGSMGADILRIEMCVTDASDTLKCGPFMQPRTVTSSDTWDHGHTDILGSVLLEWSFFTGTLDQLY